MPHMSNAQFVRKVDHYTFVPVCLGEFIYIVVCIHKYSLTYIYKWVWYVITKYVHVMFTCMYMCYVYIQICIVCD